MFNILSIKLVKVKYSKYISFDLGFAYLIDDKSCIISFINNKIWNK